MLFGVYEVNYTIGIYDKTRTEQMQKMTDTAINRENLRHYKGSGD
jgi:hypothetical protein